MLKAKELISRGYFPMELPPSFTTKNLSIAMVKIRNIKHFKARYSEPCYFSIPKNNQERRILEIPNPLHQIKLSVLIAQHLPTIRRKWLTSSKYSLSKPKISYKRAMVPSSQFSRIPVERVLRSTGTMYTLKTDIKNYYSCIDLDILREILTSPPPKKVLSDKQIENLPVDEIIQALRNSNGNRTTGIPVSPDSSLLLSEVFCYEIDREIRRKLRGVSGFRYMDDYYFYFQTEKQALLAKSKLQEIMSDFSLELNEKKTEIKSRLEETLEPNWVAELRNYKIKKGVVGQERDLISFFNLAFNHQKNSPNESILKYTVGLLKQTYIHPENWPLFEALILQTVMLQPSVLNVVAEIFITYQKLGFVFNKEKISQVLAYIVLENSNDRFSFEISWTLWIANALEIHLPTEVSRKITTIKDSVVALIALDMNEKKLFEEELDTKLWKQLMTEDQLYGEYWLLAYEALSRGWLKASNNENYILKDDFFSKLHKFGVCFYDSSISVQTNDLDLSEEEQSKLDEYEEEINQVLGY